MDGTGRKTAKAAGVAGLGAMAAGIAWSRFAVPHDLPLPPALDGELRETEGRAGRLAYYVAGEGAPLLLIHSINAAGSAYEVKPIFERAVAGRRVYAVDLPGFGFSDRSPREYRMRLYVDAIHDMLDLIAEEAGGAPIDALAVSLSGEFLARAATERPGDLRSLALVTPTGFQKGSDRLRGPEGATLEVRGLYRSLQTPVLGQALFDLLASRRSIRFFLEKTYGSKQIDEDLLDYDYLTTHQPGARHAPFAFVSGRLFSRDIRTVYERLTLPVWMPHATRGDFQDFSNAGWLRDRPNWQVEPFPTGALVHFEEPDRLFDAYERFLATPLVAAAEAHRSAGRAI
ncbi:MAG TPA: alpha/beta fold hydrolase [Beijerinckiaceae bacterium]|jgi:pimeloyl-ACP methyl ester carboxylesterase